MVWVRFKFILFGIVTCFFSAQEAWADDCAAAIASLNSQTTFLRLTGFSLPDSLEEFEDPFEKQITSDAFKVFTLRLLTRIKIHELDSSVQEKTLKKLQEEAVQRIRHAVNRNIREYLEDFISEVEGLGFGTISEESRIQLRQRSSRLVEPIFTGSSSAKAKRQSLLNLYEEILKTMEPPLEPTAMAAALQLIEERSLIANRAGKLSAIKRRWKENIASEVVEKLDVDAAVSEIVLPQLQSIQEQLKDESTKNLARRVSLVVRYRVLRLIREAHPELEGMHQDLLDSYLQEALEFIAQRVAVEVIERGLAEEGSKAAHQQVERIVAYVLDKIEARSLVLEKDFPGLASVRNKISGESLRFYDQVAFEISTRYMGYGKFYTADEDSPLPEAVKYLDARMAKILPIALKIELEAESKFYDRSAESELDSFNAQRERVIQIAFGMIRYLDSFTDADFENLEATLSKEGLRVFLRFYPGVAIALKRSVDRELSHEDSWEDYIAHAAEAYRNKIVELEQVGKLQESVSDSQSYARSGYSHLLGFEFVPVRRVVPEAYQGLLNSLPLEFRETFITHFPLIERQIDRRVAFWKGRVSENQLREELMRQMQEVLPEAMQAWSEKEKNRPSRNKNELRRRLRRELSVRLKLVPSEIEQGLSTSQKLYRSQISDPGYRNLFDHSFANYILSVLNARRWSLNESDYLEMQTMVLNGRETFFFHQFNDWLDKDLDLSQPANLLSQTRQFITELNARQGHDTESFDEEVAEAVSDRVESLLEDAMNRLASGKEPEVSRPGIENETTNEEWVSVVQRSDIVQVSAVSDAVGFYMRQAGEVPLLSTEEERNLFLRMQEIERKVFFEAVAYEDRLAEFIDRLEFALNPKTFNLSHLLFMDPQWSDEQKAGFHSQWTPRLHILLAELKEIQRKLQGAEEEEKKALSSRAVELLTQFNWRRYWYTKNLEALATNPETRNRFSHESQALMDEWILLRDRVVRSNLRLILSRAVQAWDKLPKHQKTPELLLDLIQSANLSFLDLVIRFEVDFGFKLSTYSVRGLDRKISEAIGLILPSGPRLNEEKGKLAKQIAAYRNAYFMEHGYHPSDQELEAQFGIPYSEILKIERSRQPVGSVDAYFARPNQADGRTRLEIPVRVPQVTSAEVLEPKVILRQAVEALTSDRERRVLELYFGLDSEGQSRTLAEVGEVLDVTHERIRQIKVSALEKLKYALLSLMEPLGRADLEVLSLRWGLYGEDQVKDLARIARILNMNVDEVRDRLEALEVRADELGGRHFGLE